MNISYSWLQEYVPVDLAPDVLADQLTMLGLEVDGTETLGADFNGVVVGNVLSVAQHPDADRLQVCIVNIGSDEPVQIVCGAKRHEHTVIGVTEGRAGDAYANVVALHPVFCRAGISDKHAIDTVS